MYSTNGLIAQAVDNRTNLSQFFVSDGSAPSALVTLFMAGGGPESRRLISWLSGTTQSVSPSQALWTLAAAILLIAPLPFFARWLMILPLGRPFASAIGLKRVPHAGILVVFATLLSAASTLLSAPFRL
ncbi:ABC-type Fe3+-siderophore transport system permease subunit [Phyllobacterium ifriqiyense]